MKILILILSVVYITNVTASSGKYGRLYFDAADSFFPEIYLTDGNQKIHPDWAGVYPLAKALKTNPAAYDHAKQYESYAELVKWTSVGTLAFITTLILGGVTDSDTMTLIGTVGTVGASIGSLTYQSKAMYHLHQAVNIYNKPFNRRPIIGFNWQTNF